MVGTTPEQCERTERTAAAVPGPGQGGEQGRGVMRRRWYIGAVGSGDWAIRDQIRRLPSIIVRSVGQHVLGQWQAQGQKRKEKKAKRNQELGGLIKTGSVGGGGAPGARRDLGEEGEAWASASVPL